jgi:DeoR family fructose operon transcriptional repressor
LKKIERRLRLVNILREQPGTRIPDLARLLEVSEGTVRNDLRALAASGQLTRVWGGGIPMDRHDESPTFTARSRMNQIPKRAIARAAAGLLSDGDSILLDASTTVFQMAYFLQERHNLTVVTNGIGVGRELAHDPSNTVILLGGILRPDGSAVNRPLEEHILKDLHIKTAFISSSGISMEAGLTEVDLHEAQYKRNMIASAGRLVALIDSSKFGKVDLTSCARVEQISHIFTDSSLSVEWREKLERAGVAFSLCEEPGCTGEGLNSDGFTGAVGKIKPAELERG